VSGAKPLAERVRDAAWALDSLTDLCRALLEPAAAMEGMNAGTVEVTVLLTREGKPMSSADAQKLLRWLDGDAMQNDLRSLADLITIVVPHGPGGNAGMPLTLGEVAERLANTPQGEEGEGKSE
jgi:hypothetical protein